MALHYLSRGSTPSISMNLYSTSNWGKERILSVHYMYAILVPNIILNAIHFIVINKRPHVENYEN